MLHQVRLMAERKAREAAAATADMAAAAEERVAAVEERAAAANERLVCHTEFIVELAVLCDCVSELEEESMDLQDIMLGLYEPFCRKLGKAHAAGAVSHERTTDQPQAALQTV